MTEKTERQERVYLEQMLEAVIAAEGLEPTPVVTDIARTSLRVPRSVLREVSAVAQENQMSVSLLINLLLDSYLIGQGRAAYSTLAPWYPEYALRKNSQET